VKQLEPQRSPSSAAARERFLLHPLRGMWCGIVLLGLFVLVAALVPVGPLAIDRWWAGVMRDVETPRLKDLALVFNALGRGFGRALTLVVVGLVLVHSRRWLALALFALVEGATSLSSAVVKSVVARPRPPGGVVHTLGFAFPSGHAAYVGATCLALVFLFTAPGRGRGWWSAVAALGIIGMGWSRTYLQVHWLSDVAAGSLLGTGIALLVFSGAQRRTTGARGEESAPGVREAQHA
jgi:membrane-associated phospholipid phosphatase